MRGKPEAPGWERTALFAILVTNALLYSWNLSINGWANYFYSAAVQAGTKDFEAFFFGASDWGNSISVDKPPLSLWIMGASVRIFGFTPTAMLLPQVAMGVGTTFLIYQILKRYVSISAALFGSIVFFTTPIITLMSRYNNPDPLMLLLMVAALWFTLRSLESGRGSYFAISGALLGLAFMTKQFQGLISVPALALAFMLFSSQSGVRRLRSATAAFGALVLTGGIWMTIVELVPRDQRPYVGGSASNSIFELTLGYNGIDRIAGGGVIPDAMQVPAKFSTVDNDAGIFRLLNANYNQEASWLLFAGLAAVLVLGVQLRKLSAAPTYKALLLASGLWLVTAYILLSFMGSQIHTYYTAALVPPLALILGLAFQAMIAGRRAVRTRIVGALLGLVGLLSSWLILGGTLGWPSWLPSVVLGVGVVATAALVLRPPRVGIEACAAGLLAAALLTGQAATSVHNLTVAFNGSNPVSGLLSKNPAGISHLLESLQKNELPWGHDIAFGREPNQNVVEALANSSGCRWAAASYASQTAARLQLESGRPVMPLGGFAGSDPSPTLAAFQKKVAAGEICFLVQQEAFVEVQSAESESTAISKWVGENFPPERLGDTTVYRLTK